MNELALFAGAGGGILAGVLNGWRTVCAVEIEPYCREVLLRRQRDGVLPVFPIWDDIRTFDGRPWRGLVDVVSGGFPCQPFSVAGKRLADEDERNLWPETLRVLGEARPRYALLENVPGLVAHPYFGRIIADLAALGYDAAWGIVGADDVGAPHKRKRLWIVAHADRDGREAERSGEPLRYGVGKHPAPEQGGDEQQPRTGAAGEVDDSAGARLDAGRCVEGRAIRDEARGPQPQRRGGRRAEVAHADDAGSQGRNGAVLRERAGERVARSSRSPWESDPADDPQSGVGRVAHGVAHRVHRLKALGNGQVPLVASVAWRVLTDALREG